jgi:hypothetical protein
MLSKKSLQWCVFILLGLAIIGISAQVLIVFHAQGWPMWVGSGMGLCSGLAVLFFAEKWEGPKRAVRQARQSMQFPQMWKVKFDTKTPTGVTVPIVVKRVDGVRFVVEICHELSVTWRTHQASTGSAGKSLLIGAQGKPLKPDPVEPLIKIAHAAGAAPVLWLPFGETHKNLRHTESNLKHALQGAEIVPMRPAEKAPVDGSAETAAVTQSAQAAKSKPTVSSTAVRG